MGLMIQFVTSLPVVILSFIVRRSYASLQHRRHSTSLPLWRTFLLNQFRRSSLVLLQASDDGLCDDWEVIFDESLHPP